MKLDLVVFDQVAKEGLSKYAKNVGDAGLSPDSWEGNRRAFLISCLQIIAQCGNSKLEDLLCTVVNILRTDYEFPGSNAQQHILNQLNLAFNHAETDVQARIQELIEAVPDLAK